MGPGGHHRYAVPLGRAQAETCQVGPGARLPQYVPYGTRASLSRPRGAAPRGARLPGGGPAFFIRKQGERIAGGSPLHPLEIKPLAGARSIFCVSGKRHGLFLAKVHQTRFGNAYSGKNILLDIALWKNPAKENPPKESPQIRARTWAASKRTAALLRLYPKRGSERAASGLENRGPGAKPLVFFPPFLTGEMEAAGRHPPPGALRPEAGKSLDHL